MKRKGCALPVLLALLPVVLGQGQAFGPPGAPGPPMAPECRFYCAQFDRPVCGSDQRTYPCLGALDCVRASNPALGLRHPGPCGAPPGLAMPGSGSPALRPAGQAFGVVMPPAPEDPSATACPPLEPSSFKVAQCLAHTCVPDLLSCLQGCSPASVYCRDKCSEMSVRLCQVPQCWNRGWSGATALAPRPGLLLAAMLLSAALGLGAWRRTHHILSPYVA